MISEPISCQKYSEGQKRLLLIYTGGTFAMQRKEKLLKPTKEEAFNVLKALLVAHKPDVYIEIALLEHPVDSVDMSAAHWQHLAEYIDRFYEYYSGFLIIHGTDTMSYTAAALSYMLQNLNKPIVLTGAQISIFERNSDAIPNILGAIQAIHTIDSLAEVCIYFGKKLFRGNRTTKIGTKSRFAYKSYNYPVLGMLRGMNFEYNKKNLLYNKESKRFYNKISAHVAILFLFPGLSQILLESILTYSSLEGLLLLTLGSGNCPNQAWFYDRLSAEIERGLCVLEVSQCPKGKVRIMYDSAQKLSNIGVIHGLDMSKEAAFVKLMFAIAQQQDHSKRRTLILKSIAGECSEE